MLRMLNKNILKVVKPRIRARAPKGGRKSLRYELNS